MRRTVIHILVTLAITACVISCKRNGEASIGEQSMLTDSIEYLTKAIRKSPHDASLFVKRSDLQLLQDNLDEAINDMEIALRIDTTRPSYYPKLASLYMLKNGKTEDAKNILEKCIERYPFYVQAHNDLAKIYLYVGMFQEAMQEIMQIENNQIQNGETYFIKGMVLRKASETDSDTASCNRWRRDALAAFKKAVEYDNDNWEAYNLIGETYTEIGDTIALEYYKTAASKFSDNQEIRYFKAWSLKAFGRYEEAKDTYIEAYDMDSISYWAYMSSVDLGDMYFNISLEDNKYEIAAKYYTQALACDTTAFEVFTKRGDAYRKMKKFQLAEADFRHALKLSPNYEAAVDGLNKAIDRE